MSDKFFELTDVESGTSSRLGVSEGSIGPAVVDIGRLYRDHGVFTFDPGFVATASCESKITYIDGDDGVLLYRGYPIEQLAANSTFLEVAYLLLYGELPTAANSRRIRGLDHAPHDDQRDACCGSSMGSISTPTRWRWCPASSARCRRSITTP